MHRQESIARVATWWTLTVGVTVAVAVFALLAVAGEASSFHWIWTCLPPILWAFGLAGMDKEDRQTLRILLRWIRVKAASAYSVVSRVLSRAVRGLSALFTTHHIQTEP